MRIDAFPCLALFEKRVLSAALLTTPDFPPLFDGDTLRAFLDGVNIAVVKSSVPPFPFSNMQNVTFGQHW